MSVLHKSDDKELDRIRATYSKLAEQTRKDSRLGKGDMEVPKVDAGKAG